MICAINMSSSFFTHVTSPFLYSDCCCIFGSFLENEWNMLVKASIMSIFPFARVKPKPFSASHSSHVSNYLVFHMNRYLNIFIFDRDSCWVLHDIHQKIFLVQENVRHCIHTPRLLSASQRATATGSAISSIAKSFALPPFSSAL